MIAQVWPISTDELLKRTGGLADVARTLVLIFAMLLFSSQLAFAQFAQQGPKLVGSDAVVPSYQGPVALSADGNTAIVGGSWDNHDPSGNIVGAAGVFTRSGGIWTQQGDKLVGTGAVAVLSPSLRDATACSTSDTDNRSILGDRPISTMLAPPGDNFRHASEKKFSGPECPIRT